MTDSISHTIASRRSIRVYKDLPVSKEQWQAVIEAGSQAPSTGNIQNWKFLVVRERSKRKKIAHLCNNQVWMENAPVHIIICADEKIAAKYYDDKARDYSIQNCAAAAQNMVLRATELGLGSCWVNAFDESKFKKSMGIDTTPVAVIVIGYAGEKVPTPPKRDFYETVYLENYGEAEDTIDDALNRKKYSDVRKDATPKILAPFIDIWRAIVSSLKRSK